MASSSSSGVKEKCSSSRLESDLTFSMFTNIVTLHSFGRRVYTVYTVPRVYTRIYRIYSYHHFHFMLVNKMNILFVNIDGDGLDAYDCYMERAMQRAL